MHYLMLGSPRGIADGTDQDGFRFATDRRSAMFRRSWRTFVRSWAGRGIGRAEFAICHTGGPIIWASGLPAAGRATRKEIMMVYLDGPNEFAARAYGGARPLRPASPRTGRNQRVSQLTLLEECAWRDQGLLDFSHGYPTGLSPGWIVQTQTHPASGFLDRPPAEYLSVVRGYFQRIFRVDNVRLTPTCSLAFAIAMSALITGPSDEIVVLEGSYDSHVLLAEAVGARVVRARRGADGSADTGNVAAQCTEHTRAIVLCCPDNPLGVVHSRSVLEEVIALCKRRRLTLVMDHCLAQVSPYGAEIPVISHLRSSSGLSWMALGDTGKILGLSASKVGAIACSGNYAERLATAQSPWFFQLPQYDLYLLATILPDERFPAYLRALNRQISENYAFLAANLSERWYRVMQPQAGCFCLIEIRNMGVDDVSYVRYLKTRHNTLLIPASYFWPGQQAPSARVRVSLSRHPKAIRKLAEAMNNATGSRG
jgi:N-succinyldiaminopimelate aminotransferase